MFSFLVLFAAGVAFANIEPPKSFVDRGACPFECCTYRDWSVKADTPLYKSIQDKSVVGTAKKGTRVTAITGEVHTEPGKVTVITNHGRYKTGDEVFVLTYLGEGIYKVWFKGDVSEDAEIYEILDERVQKGVGPNASKEQWAKRNKQPKSIWWARIKLKNGSVGWTTETSNFGNMDACDSEG